MKKLNRDLSDFPKLLLNGVDQQLYVVYYVKFLSSIGNLQRRAESFSALIIFIAQARWCALRLIAKWKDEYFTMKNEIASEHEYCKQRSAILHVTNKLFAKQSKKKPSGAIGNLRYRIDQRKKKKIESTRSWTEDFQISCW